MRGASRRHARALPELQGQVPSCHLTHLPTVRSDQLAILFRLGFYSILWPMAFRTRIHMVSSHMTLSYDDLQRFVAHYALVQEFQIQKRQIFRRHLNAPSDAGAK